MSTPVINAGDGMNEHPTQALLDMFTMRERNSATCQGLRWPLSATVAHSRVARTNLWGLTPLGSQVGARRAHHLDAGGAVERTGVRVTNWVEDAVGGADVVMGLRIQRERQQQAACSPRCGSIATCSAR